MESKKIMSQHHLGKMMPLWVILSDLAAQENCDGEPYDQMQEASEYIKELEELVTELEQVISKVFNTSSGKIVINCLLDLPKDHIIFKLLGNKGFKGFKGSKTKEPSLSAKDGVNPDPDHKPICILANVCRKEISNKNCNACPSYIDKKPMRTLLGEFYDAPVLDIIGPGCIRCSGTDFLKDMDTKNNRCCFCGQKYICP